MQEKQVTIGDHSYKLEKPFLVLATQNPVEQEGTYMLPEAQVDRFMLKVVIDYPEAEDEKLIIKQNLQKTATKINAVVSQNDILSAMDSVKDVYMDDKIIQYIIDIIGATRYPDKFKLNKLAPLISFGASPRGSINLAIAAKSYAFVKRRGYVLPEDIRAVCYDVLRHRIGLSYEAEATNVKVEEIIKEVLNMVEVP